MSSSKNVEELPPIQLVENRGWKVVEVNGTDKKIPEDWKHFDLGEVATFSKGKGLSKKALIEDGLNECIHYGELFTKYGSAIDTIRSKTDTPKDNMALSMAGDVLMPTSDVTPNGLATASSINQDGVILGGDILVIRPDLAEIHPPLLSRVIREEKSQIMGLVSGSTVYHIYAKDMKVFSLSLPPLPEQSLIAQVLTNQESQVHDLRKLAALERQRLSWLSDELLSGRLRVEEDPTAESVVVSRNEKGEPVEVLPGVRLVENRGWKVVEVNGKEIHIPTSWTAQRLDSICTLHSGIPAPKDFVDNGLPFIRVSTLHHKGAVVGGKHAKEFLPPGMKSVPAGTLLVAKSGESIHQHYRNITSEPCVIVGHIAGMEPQDGVVVEYIRYYLRSHPFEKELAQGGATPSIGMRELGGVEVLVMDTQEQSLIAQVLTAQETQASEIERLADLEQKRLEWLSDELLSGRIRVRAVDAEDEQENTP